MADPTDPTWDLVAEQPDPFESLANIDRRTNCMSWRTAVKRFDDAVVNPTLWNQDTLREIAARVEDEYKASWSRRQIIWDIILPVQDGDEPWDGFDDEMKQALQERTEYRDGLNLLHQHLRQRIHAAEAQHVPAASASAPIVEALAPATGDAAMGEGSEILAAVPTAVAPILTPVAGLSESAVPDQKQSRPGPKPDSDSHRIVREIVERIVPAGVQLITKLEEVSEALDDARFDDGRPRVPVPPTWKDLEPPVRSWTEACTSSDDRERAVKAIKYRVEAAGRHG